MLSRTTLATLGRLAVVTLISWATVAHPPTTRASLIQFSGPPAPAGSLTFSYLGQLSGSVPINLVGPAGTGSTGPAFAVTDGLLTFRLGSPAGGNIQQGFNFSYGGSITLTGSFNGGPSETILACAGQLNGAFLANVGPGGAGATGPRWRFDLGEIPYVGTFARDVAAAYGLGGGAGGAVVVGEFSVDFTGVPGGVGGVDAGAIVGAGFDASVAPVPELGSGVMVGIAGFGIGIAVGVVGFVRKRRVVF